MPIKLIAREEGKFLAEPTPKEVIDKMIEEYEKELRGPSTARLRRKYPHRPDIEETKSAWVSRKEIDALLNDNHGNGIRIYFGIHYKSTNPNGNGVEYEGQHNLILVATRDDVNPNDPTTENSRDLLAESLNPEEANSVIFNDDYTNMGSDLLPLCPPKCP